MDCSPPGSFVHEILQARILKWIVISFSKGSSHPRDWACISFISCTGRRNLTTVPPGKPEVMWEIVLLSIYLYISSFVNNKIDIFVCEYEEDSLKILEAEGWWTQVGGSLNSLFLEKGKATLSSTLVWSRKELDTTEQYSLSIPY